jgi:Flp pilus assembly protein TadG
MRTTCTGESDVTYQAPHTDLPTGAVADARRCRRQRGAAAVEFALVAPLMILLTLGIIDFGLYINEASVVGNAAREGARAGSLGGTSSDINAAVTSSLSALPSAPTTTSVTCRKPAGTACTSYADAASGGTTIVRITRTHSWLTPIGLGTSIAVVRSSEMRIE